MAEKRSHPIQENEQDGFHGEFLTTAELLKCEIDNKRWLCPVSSCKKQLSRKQTLQGHLFSKHGITLEQPSKRYKLYEFDENVPVPRSTYSYWKSKHGKESVPSTDEDQPDMIVVTEESDSAELLCPSDFPTPNEELENGSQSDLTPDLEFLANLNDDDFHEGDESVLDDSDMSNCDDSDMSFSDESSSDDLLLDVVEDPNVSDSTRATVDRKFSSPATYVIPASMNTYRSSITQQEHILAVTAYSTRHYVSDTGIKDLLSLIQIHIPEKNICEKNVHSLKKLCGFSDDYLQYHMYCNTCNKLYFNTDRCVTPGCGNVRVSPGKQSYFITCRVKQELKEILERDGIWDEITETHKRKSVNSLSDITCGLEYIKLKQPGQFLHSSNNITLTMFTDGIPLFKSSSVSLWPVYLLINEISPKNRFLRKNMILWGIWQGVSKPKMNMFLRPLVVDLLDLYNSGLTISRSSKPVKAMLIVATMDLPARAYVLHMIQHNGEYGCVYCMEPGKVVKSGNGTCRTFPFKNPPLLSAKSREQSEIRKHAEIAQKNGVRLFGFCGMSVIMFLKYFSFSKNVVIDYMHGILLGITKKLLSLWLDAENCREQFFIGDRVKDLDKLLKTVKPPYMIHRLPRKIKGNYQRWKASELRSWLLFYSLPVLKDILPNVYLVHFSCLVESTNILLGEGISDVDLIRAEWLLHSFVRNVPLLYRENVMGMNVHNLTHITECVRNWGPMWAWSCFVFESFNGEIKKGVHGTGNVCRQIFWHLQGQKQVEKYLQSDIPHGPVKDYLRSMSEGSLSKLPKGNEAYQCAVLKTTDLKTLSDDVKGELERLTGLPDLSPTSFWMASKIIRNCYIMYSRQCVKVKKRNSYTIRLHKPIRNALYVEVMHYIVHKATNHVYAVCNLLTSKGSVVQGRCPHLQELSHESARMGVVKAEDLREPAVAVWTGNRLFAGILPNRMERD